MGRRQISRPKPSVLLEYVNKETYKSDQVLDADGIWAVFYKGNPFNLKTIDYSGRSEPKYKKIAFSNKGHALNLAKKLNKTHQTTEFEVFKLLHGEKIN